MSNLVSPVRLNNIIILIFLINKFIFTFVVNGLIVKSQVIFHKKINFFQNYNKQCVLKIEVYPF